MQKEKDHIKSFHKNLFLVLWPLRYHQTALKIVLSKKKTWDNLIKANVYINFITMKSRIKMKNVLRFSEEKVLYCCGSRNGEYKLNIEQHSRNEKKTSLHFSFKVWLSRWIFFKKCSEANTSWFWKRSPRKRQLLCCSLFLNFYPTNIL